jgi:hypothetical protein
LDVKGEEAICGLKVDDRKGTERLAAARRPVPPLEGKWFGLPTRIVLLLIIACAFLLRLRAASGTFFNPDECVHVLVANQGSLAATYQASLGEAHPPLLFFLLYLWRSLGSSEWILRLPSVIAGSVFCWAFFYWLRNVLGDEVAWAGLVFASFLPPMIELSAEVRQYALLLCFMMLSLYFLETAFSANSAARMGLSVLFLYLAMLTHFSAILFAGAVGIYSLLRVRGRGFSRSLIAFWAAGMAGCVALFSFFYRTHISQLHGSPVAGRMEQLLSRSYFHWGQDHLLLFAFGRTFGVCQWVFGQLAIGDVAGLAFFAGVFFLFRGKSQEKAAWFRMFGILLLLPFIINCAAAIAGIYPYGGTRHSAFLAPFVLAGVSIALVRLAGENLTRVVGIAVLMAVSCHLFGKPHRPYMLRQDQSVANMASAMAAIRSQVAPSDPIFVDFQTYFVIRYYLCPEIANAWDSSVPGFRSFNCRGHKVISTEPDLNIFSADSFVPSWQRRKDAFRFAPGRTIWIFQAGWDIRLAGELQARPAFRGLISESFGKNINLSKLAVP